MNSLQHKTALVTGGRQGIGRAIVDRFVAEGARVMTGMADAAFAVANDPEAAKKDALARHPAGRLGKPDDIASLAAWLASNEAGFATGQCYTLDGGMTAASPLNPGLF